MLCVNDSRMLCEIRGNIMMFTSRSLQSASLLGLLLTIIALHACNRSEPEVSGQTPALVSLTKETLSPALRNTASYTALKAITEAQLGVPIYPGAQPKDGGSWQMTDTLAEGAESLLVATLQSDDSVEKVAAFYTHELKVSPADVLRIPTRSGDRFSITIQTHGRATINILLESAVDVPGTWIKITRMGNRLAAATKAN